MTENDINLANHTLNKMNITTTPVEEFWEWVSLFDWFSVNGKAWLNYADLISQLGAVLSVLSEGKLLKIVLFVG